MKKYLVAGAALVASLSSSAFAANFTGPYAGLTLGANSLQSGYTQSSGDGNGSERTRSASTLFNYGLFGGYGQTFGQFYVGGELLLATTSGQAKYASGNNAGTAFALATVKETYSVNPVVRLGALIAPKTLAFVKMGVAGSQFKASAIPLGAGRSATTYKKTLWGYSLGAGMETLVTDSISVRADYTFNLYPTKTFSVTGAPGNAPDTAKISPRDNVFRLGVAYNFSL